MGIIMVLQAATVLFYIIAIVASTFIVARALFWLYEAFMRFEVTAFKAGLLRFKTGSNGQVKADSRRTRNISKPLGLIHTQVALSAVRTPWGW